MALKVGELVAHIRADTRHLRQGLRTAHRELSSFHQALMKIARPAFGFGMAAAKATVGAAGLAAAVGTVAIAVTGLASALAGAIPLIVHFGAVLLQTAGAAALIPGALAAIGAVVGTLKLGMSGLGDAMKAVASGDAEKLNEALKRLAPNAKAFVRQVNTLRPAWEKLRLGVQNRLFAQTAGLLKGLAASTLPTLTGGMNRLAEVLNRGVVAALAALNTKTNQATITTVFASAARMADSLAAALRPVGQALFDVVGVGAQVTAQLTSGIGAALGAFAERVSQMAASGELKTMILDGLDALREFWQLGKNVLGLFRGIAHAAGMESGRGLFAIIERINAVINSPQGQAALTKIFDELGRLGIALTPVLTAVLSALVPVAKGIAQIAGDPKVIAGVMALATSLGQALGSLAPGFIALAPLVKTLATGLQPLADILVGLVTGAAGGANSFLVGLVGGLKALADSGAAAAVGKALGAILSAVAPLLPVLGHELARILIALAPLIIKWVDALIPAIPMITELLVLVTSFAADLMRTGFAMRAAEGSAALLIVSLKIVTGVLHLAADAISFVIRLFSQDAPRAVEGFGERAKNALGNLGTLLFDAGRDLLAGLINGIKSKFGEVKGILGDLTGKLADWKGPAGLDRRILFGSGQLVLGGFMAGIRSQIPALRTQLAGVTAGMAPQLGLAGVGGGRSVRVNVTVPDALAWLKDQIKVEIDEYDDSTAATIRGGTRL